MCERKGRKRLAPEQRREEIVVAAYRVFAAHDPATVTFEEIAAQAGVSRALVYNYFGDKGSLLAAVYAHAIADLDADLVEQLAADELLSERLRNLVLHYVAFAQSRSGTWHILSYVAATQHPAVQEVRRARVDRLAAVLGTGPTLRLAVAGLIGMLEEVLTQWLAKPEVSIDELLSVLCQQAWSGFGALLDSRATRFVS